MDHENAMNIFKCEKTQFHKVYISRFNIGDVQDCAIQSFMDGGWWQGSGFCFSYQNAFGSKSLELISNAFMDEEDWVNHDCTNLATKSRKKEEE